MPDASLLELRRASELLRAAPDRAELRAVVAAARLHEDLHDPGQLRQLQGLLPRSFSWAFDRLLWNAGVRSIAELLEERGIWKTLRTRCSDGEYAALIEALRAVIGGALSDRERDTRLDDLAAVHARDLSPPGVACPPDQLGAWAQAMGVAELLDTFAVEALRDRGEPEIQVFTRRMAVSRLTVGRAVAGPTWPTLGERARKQGAPLVVQEQCLRWLRRAAARRELGRRDEEARLADLAETAPDVPSLAAQDGALRALRRSLRVALPPMMELDRVPYQIAVVDEPPRLVVRLGRPPDPVGELGARCRKDPALTLPLSGGGAATIGCDCQPGAASCPAALQAVDAALDELREAGPVRDAVRTLLERPRWHRAVAELEALAEHAQRLAEAPVLGWRVVPDGIDTSIDGVAVTPLKSGGFRTRRLDPEELQSALDASDQPQDARVAGFGGLPVSGRAALDRRERVRFGLRELVGHPRVFVGARSREVTDVREAGVAVVADRREGALHLRLEAGGAVLKEPLLRLLADQRGFAGPPFLVEPARITVLRAAPELAALADLLLRHGARFEGEATEPVLEALHRLERAVPVELDEALRGEAAARRQSLLVRLELRAQGSLALSVRVQPLDGGPVLRPGLGRRFVHGRSEESRVHVQRDLPAERTATLELADVLGLEVPDEHVVDWLVVDPREAAEVVAKLEGLSAAPDGPVVQWTGRPMRFTTATGRSLRIGVRSMEQWFGLEGKLSVHGAEVPLEQLLELLEAGRRFVQVAEGDWVRIDESLASALESVVAGAFLDRGRRVLSPLHAPSLDGLSAAGVRLELPPDWTATRERIRAAAQQVWVPPPGFVGTLRAYQRDGAAWMARCAEWAPGCCLADDMGLGKTLQALALLASRAARGPALVVAPASVGFNWVREAETFTPGLAIHVYRGSERADLLAGVGPGDVLITSWSLMVRDVEPLGAVPWATAVFDEAQAAKNPDSARSSAARQLGAAFKVGLTGTPVENRPEDLWALFAMLAPGLLGSRDRFRRRYAAPISRGEDAPRARLATLVRPLLLRRLKSQVARELPARTEVDVRVQLGVDERALYDEVRTTGLAALAHRGQDGQLRFQVLALLTRLRQAACHPRLVQHDSPLRSAKLERVRQLVRELHEGGHKALIFSQFLGHLALVREALEADGYRLRSIDGSTPLPVRQREIDAFQAGDGDVFLISLKAGGVGLNLTAASYVFHLDPWWNPAVEDQATDRAHRIGQDRPVTVYRLIARDTVEEAIVELHRVKRALVDELLAGSGTSAALGADEILAMLRT